MGDSGMGAWETGMGDSGGELFGRSCCYFYVAGEGFGGKSFRLIGKGFYTFLIKGFDYIP